jgi:hypothetical protein
MLPVKHAQCRGRDSPPDAARAASSCSGKVPRWAAAARKYAGTPNGPGIAAHGYAAPIFCLADELRIFCCHVAVSPDQDHDETTLPRGDSVVQVLKAAN